MKIDIDFSIFCSPTDAYGCVTGTLDFEQIPDAGETVKLFDLEDQFNEFNGTLKVEHFIREHNVLMFGGVVLNSSITADSLAEKLEMKYGLFVVKYHE
jgi:hypothetical protein